MPKKAAKKATKKKTTKKKATKKRRKRFRRRTTTYVVHQCATPAAINKIIDDLGADDPEVSLSIEPLHFPLPKTAGPWLLFTLRRY